MRASTSEVGPAHVSLARSAARRISSRPRRSSPTPPNRSTASWVSGRLGLTHGSLLHNPQRISGFRNRPVLGRLQLREFFIRSQLLVKENMIFEFLKTDYELSKIRSNTCTSTCRSYFMFTLEKTSNDVKFHVIFVNY